MTIGEVKKFKNLYLVVEYDYSIVVLLIYWKFQVKKRSWQLSAHAANSLYIVLDTPLHILLNFWLYLWGSCKRWNVEWNENMVVCSLV